MKVMIGVPTYRRPQMLARALESVAKLTTPCGVELLVVVADNNPDGSAAPIVERAAASSATPMRWAHQPRRGISSARNALLAAALEANVDWIAFFDDDETVRPDWLAQLTAAAAAQSADVVTGLVNSTLPPDAPAWAARLYRAKPRRTGDKAESVATSNVFFSIRLARDWGLRFDERLNLSGGEDVAFFDAAAARGARMIWCAEAWVDEPVHPERLTPRAVFLRYLGGASSGVTVHRLQYGRWAAARRFAPRAMEKLALAALYLPLALMMPERCLARLLGHAGSGVGMTVGLLGLMHKRYQITQGN